MNLSRLTRRNTVLWITALILVLVFFVYIPTALAQGEQSNSPGEPGKKPLKFVGVTLKDSGAKLDGASNIPTSPEFKLEFDKNVVNMLVWENNRKCFSLSTKDGEDIPVNVTKIDDTVSSSDRHYIFIKPVNPLEPNTAYVLKVAPELLAKNQNSTLGGTTDGKGVAIYFRTEGEGTDSEPADELLQEDTAPSKTSSGVKITGIIAAMIIVSWVLVEVVWKRRKNG